MRLYLVRHGKALSKDVSPDKALSDEGVSEVGKVAALLKPLDLKVDAIWQSGMARAEETAEILAKSVMAGEGVIEKDGLNPNDNIAPVVAELNGMNEDIMLVGHLPFMERLASELLADNADAMSVAFEAGAVICIERNYNKIWSLIWMVTPQLITRATGP